MHAAKLSIACSWSSSVAGAAPLASTAAVVSTVSSEATPELASPSPPQAATTKPSATDSTIKRRIIDVPFKFLTRASPTNPAIV
jgi:hypothetical protein